MTETVELYWPRESAFMDNQADLRFNGSGVYEVPARLEAFYRTRGWEDPPEDHEGDADTPDSAQNRNLDGPTRDQLEGADPAEVMDDTDDEDDAENAEGDSSSSEDDGEDGGDSGN